LSIQPFALGLSTILAQNVLQIALSRLGFCEGGKKVKKSEKKVDD
jgi:hypothetical protein